MAYTLDQLRAFVAVAEEGSFTRAATRLSMTQPPLSRAVQALERGLGTTLVDRHHQGARLTPAGRLMLDRAQTILGMVDATRSQVLKVAAGTTGALSIGYTAMSARAVLAPWVRAVADRLPGVDLRLREMVTGRQVEALLGGSLDAGIVRDFPAETLLRTTPVHREPLLLVLPQGHELTTGGPVTLEKVAAYDLVGYTHDEARYFHDLVATAFQRVGCVPRVVQEATQVNSVVTLVEAGFGIGLVPASALRLTSLTYLRLEELESLPVTSRLAWRHDNDNPVLHRALGLIHGPAAPA